MSPTENATSQADGNLVDLMEETIVRARLDQESFDGFVGVRYDDSRGPIVVMVKDGERVELKPRFDLANHSPDGFEWGFAGSGPSQLALALCAEVLGDDTRALRIHQDFKFRLVAMFGRTWSLSREDALRLMQNTERAIADLVGGGV